MRSASALPPALENILDVARWAPSGDNAQPWTFEILSEDKIILYVHCATENVYEYADGQPTLISAGALLENIEVAAPAFHKQAHWQYRGLADNVHAIEISFQANERASSDPLFAQIERRSVDRRPYKMQPLTAEQRATLAACLDGNIQLSWFEALADRWKIAKLNRMATEIRLRIPETFEIHNRIVDWDNVQSIRGIPALALGLDPFTLKIMRWTLARRRRTEIANALGSPATASLQMDILPGLFCAGYFAFSLDEWAQEAQQRVIQILKVGQSMQRFWLQATSIGLVIQPCLAPLAFAYYGSHKQVFTSHRSSEKAAERLSVFMREILGFSGQTVFLGRIGFPRSPSPSRSLRHPLTSLVRAQSIGS